MISKTPDLPESPETVIDEAAVTETSGSSGDQAAPPEIGGRGGLDPTRYGDWEKNGRCIDF